MAIQLQFTNNFYSWISTVFLSDSNPDGTTYTNGAINTIPTPIFANLIDKNNARITSFGMFQYYYEGANSCFSQIPIANISANNTSGNVMNSRVIFGTGETPFSATDYSLANEITEGITVQLSAVHFTQDTNAVLNITASVKNTGNSTITIKEVGLSKCIYNFRNAHEILFARGVYPNGEGVEIAANTTKEITIQLSMSAVAPSA